MSSLTQSAVRPALPAVSRDQSDFGSRLVIWVFCLTQFADISFGLVANLPMTLQKLLGLCAYPVALVLLRRAPVGVGMRYFGGALLAAYSVAGLFRPAIVGGVISADMGVVIGAFAAYLLYLALGARPEAFDDFLRVWTLLAVVTSGIGLLQVAGLLPTVPAIDKDADFAMMSDGVRRGWGLKADANFQALMLVIGLATARLARIRYRWLAIGVILGGLLATFSRMGIVLGLAALFVTSLLERRRDHRRAVLRVVGRYLLVALLLAALATAGIMLGLSRSAELFLERMSEATSVLDLLAEGAVEEHQDRNLNSTEARTALLLGSIEIAGENLPFGIGPYQSEPLMYERLGLYNVAHNVYMEWVMIGGVFGLLPPVVFVMVLRRARRRGRVLADRRGATLLLVLALVLGIGGLFLSLTYNSFIWLPLALADWLHRNSHEPAPLARG